jgi:TatD DNase family protein
MTDNGIFVSLGPAILKDSKKTESIVKEAPLEFLFVETDTGEAGIKDIYKTVAEIRGMRIDMLKENIFNNFQKIFGNG